ncbi:hypothetical protein CABS03_06424 [Colletotrichum abscissum]|uniref:Secreted protein n=2 Tax=Colletotrichum acutatum species complex TaxID=2707335 RepID=A0A9P9X887_9PEZI|nr:hypothetical protein CABS02_10349 [Colletotrichum abscissum]KAK0378386.1 hypothetical protein CLIM01_04228 [Colletotrichum limetticola]KAK1715930.1 hypothetical protein BDP67DRAFT_511496 [Colletotrichum lupini]
MSSRMNPSTWWLAILSPLLEACHSPRTASHLIKRSSWWRNPSTCSCFLASRRMAKTTLSHLHPTRKWPGG